MVAEIKERRFQVNIRLTRDEFLGAVQAAQFLDLTVSQMARQGIRGAVSKALSMGLIIDDSEGAEERWK